MVIRYRITDPRSSKDNCVQNTESIWPGLFPELKRREKLLAVDSNNNIYILIQHQPAGVLIPILSWDPLIQLEG